MAVGLGIIPQFPASVSTSDSSILLSVANGVFDFKVNPNGTPSVAGVNFSSGIMGHILAQRQAIPQMAVPTLRPTTPNSPLALDLMPNGTVTTDPFGSDFITWIDICSHDINNNFTGTNTLLGLRNRVSCLEITSQVGGGATLKPIVFSVGGGGTPTEIFRLNQTTVGIGTKTNSTSSKLEVSNNAGALPVGIGASIARFGEADGTLTRISMHGFGDRPILSLTRANNTNASPSAITSGQFFGQIEIGGWTGTGYASPIGILGVAEEAWNGTAQGAGLDIFTVKQTTTTSRNTARFTGLGGLSLARDVAPPAGGTAGLGLLFSTTANLGLFFGSGAPTLSAAQGSLYIRTDGSSTSTRAYVNTNGTTGWAAITTAS